MVCSESRPSMINITADKQEVHKLHLNNIGIEIVNRFGGYNDHLLKRIENVDSLMVVLH